MSSAQARVFDTPELLEAILLQLPPRDLLFAQRLSRHFQTTITTSPILQQLLFLRPVPLKDPKKWSLNPLLRDLFIPWLVILAPKSSVRPSYESIEMMDCFSDEPKKDAFLRKEASWRSMLLLQPPPKVLEVTQFLHSMTGDFAFDATHSFEASPTGSVTTGVVYDITESFTQDDQCAWFGVSVLESEAGPQMTLYLRSSKQCCPMEVARRVDARSKGAEVQFDDLDFKTSAKKGNRVRLDMTWLTGLSVEKGGVDAVEFESWTRKRAPISSLLSDVR